MTLIVITSCARNSLFIGSQRRMWGIVICEIVRTMLYDKILTRIVLSHSARDHKPQDRCPGSFAEKCGVPDSFRLRYHARD